jgi:hypothetical protein
MNEHLTDFDRYATQAVEQIVNQLNSNPKLFIALARTRLVTGFDQYPDGPMFTWGAQRLSSEGLEEVSDAIVYKACEIAKRLERLQAS